ncbi:MAG: cupin domain-containing protein [Acidobacteria bacterium]|nr:cupin domain-containing protein [Acidobacteriota bacterium]
MSATSSATSTTHGKWNCCSSSRGSERISFPEAQDVSEPAYDFEALNYTAVNRPLDAYLATFRSPAAMRLHTHQATEFLHVLSGTLLVIVDGDRFELAAGDSLHICSGAAHGYASTSEEPCRAVVVLTAEPTSRAQDAQEA